MLRKLPLAFSKMKKTFTETFNKIKLDTNRLILASLLGAILSLILGFGGYAQTLFVNGLFSESASLYDTLTPSGCVCLLSKPLLFFDWLKSLFSVPLLILSIINCYLALRFHSTRRLLIWLSIGIFFTLMANDTYMYFFHPESQASLRESYLCNALGAPVIAVCICMILYLTRKATELFLISFQLANIVFPLIFGIFIFIILFIVIKGVFFPTKSSISAFISPPFYGDYITTPVSVIKEKFGIFTNQRIEIENFTWEGKFSNMGIEIEHPTKTAEVSLFLFEGCYRKSTKELLNSLGKANLSQNNVSKIGMSVDDGPGVFSIYSRDHHNGYWGVYDDKLTNFRIDSSKNISKLDLTLFSDGESNIIHKDWKGEVIYRVDTYLFDDRKTIPRKLSITTDGKVANHVFNVRDSLSLDKVAICKPIKSSQDPPYLASPFLTSLLRITYPQVKTIKDINESPNTSVHGLIGPLEVKEITLENLSSYVSSGELNMLSIVGNFDELFIDGKKQDKRKSNWLYMQDGVITGKTEKGSFHFDGKTENAMLDGERVSKTRWERISTSVKWFILVILGYLGVLLRSFLTCWLNDEKLVNL